MSFPTTWPYSSLYFLQCQAIINDNDLHVSRIQDELVIILLHSWLESS